MTRDTKIVFVLLFCESDPSWNHVNTPYSNKILSQIFLTRLQI